MTTQTKTTYTPGPWAVLHHDGARHDGDRGIYGPGDKWICDMNGGPNDNNGTLANARLIASAPELIDALKSAHYFLLSHKDYEVTNLYNKILNAISKAEGSI